MLMWLLEQGGVVTWVILGLGVVAFFVYLERSFAMHRARIPWDDFLQGIYNILDRDNEREALTICGETPGPVAVIVRTAIQHRKESGDTLRTAVKEATLSEISQLERRLVMIASVAQIAPLLGLLGTILAMVTSAVVMRSQAPLLQAPDLMGSLLEALVSTAAGLCVAIPCHGASHLLLIKVDRLVLDMERASLDIISYLRSDEGRRES